MSENANMLVILVELIDVDLVGDWFRLSFLGLLEKSVLIGEGLLLYIWATKV